MSKNEAVTVLEALRSAELEITTLIEEDIHVPSGELVSQLREAILIVNADVMRR